MLKPLFGASAFLASSLFLNACSLEQLIETTSDRGVLSTDDKVVLGLRTALKVGIDSSANAAARVNGYLTHRVIKILLPEEAKQALDAAEKVGAYVKPFASELEDMQTLVNFTTGLDKNAFTSNLSASSSLLSNISGLESIGDSVVKYMNRAAEYAAPRSVPIFKDAITAMTLTDGLSLLNSADSTAATAYLNGKTFDPLVTSYTPIVDSTLALVPLTRYWGDFKDAYNGILSQYNKLLAFQANWNGNAVVANVSALRISVLKPVDYRPIQTQSLGEWTTDKALTGLFYLVGEEEKDIRRDPFGYVKNLVGSVADILSEVFGEIMRMDKP